MLKDMGTWMMLLRKLMTSDMTHFQLHEKITFLVKVTVGFSVTCSECTSCMWWTPGWALSRNEEDICPLLTWCLHSRRVEVIIFPSLCNLFLSRKLVKLWKRNGSRKAWGYFNMWLSKWFLPDQMWACQENWKPLKKFSLLFWKQNLSAWPSTGGSGYHIYRQRKTCTSPFPLLKPNYGHDEDLWNPTSTYKKKALSSCNLPFICNITYNVSFLQNQTLSHQRYDFPPEKALKYPAAITSVHKH